MRIQQLMEAHFILNETKCAIYNTLKKFRPDLNDEIERIPGRDVGASVSFLQDNNLWDDEAERLMKMFLYRLGVFQKGPDEWSKGELRKAQDALMCHVAKLIRQSAPD